MGQLRIPLTGARAHRPVPHLPGGRPPPWAIPTPEIYPHLIGTVGADPCAPAPEDRPRLPDPPLRGSHDPDVRRFPGRYPYRRGDGARARPRPRLPLIVGAGTQPPVADPERVPIAVHRLPRPELPRLL